MHDLLDQLRTRSLAARCGLVAAVVLALYMLVAGGAWYLGGSLGLMAAGVAAGLCLLGALFALAAGAVFRGPQFALHALAAGMAVRMGIPLVPALALHLHGGPLTDAGFLYYLLIFYPVTLALDTALSLPPAGQRAANERS